MVIWLQGLESNQQSDGFKVRCVTITLPCRNYNSHQSHLTSFLDFGWSLSLLSISLSIMSIIGCFIMCMVLIARFELAIFSLKGRWLRPLVYMSYCSMERWQRVELWNRSFEGSALTARVTTAYGSSTRNRT